MESLIFSLQSVDDQEEIIERLAQALKPFIIKALNYKDSDELTKLGAFIDKLDQALENNGPQLIMTCCKSYEARTGKTISSQLMKKLLKARGYDVRVGTARRVNCVFPTIKSKTKPF